MAELLRGAQHTCRYTYASSHKAQIIVTSADSGGHSSPLNFHTEKWAWPHLRGGVEDIFSNPMNWTGNRIEDR